MEDCPNGDQGIGLRQGFDNPSPETSTPATDTLTHLITPIIRFTLVILLRIGFLLIQIGSVPITNVNLILLQNILDFCWVNVVFIFIGTLIAYNGNTGDTLGLIGGGYWVGNESIDKEEIIIGWQASVIASAICTTCIVGRMHTLGSIILGIIMSGVLQPFIIHWTWTTNGWMAKNKIFNSNVYFRDYGGSGVIHIVGGLTGLIGCMVLGRRLLRLRDIDNASISVGSAATAFSGHLFIVMGLQTLLISHSSSSNNEKLKKRIPTLPVNSLIAISSCAIIVVGLHFIMRDPFNHWTVMRCIQALTAGAIIVSAGVDVYSPAICLALGCIGGILFYLSSKFIFRTALEDYCNIISMHIILAFFGSLVAPFFYDFTDEPSETSASIWINFLWKIICLLCIILLIIIVMAPLFFLLNWIGLLRNRSEFLNHVRSLAVIQRTEPRSIVKRLFNVDDDSILVQPAIPGQEFEIISGALSSKYNRTITRFEIDAVNDVRTQDDSTSSI
ncbi:hypothetical protein PV328_003201 [Microctonus aethiopoides]|uniref:Ammonium transporter AmtB-like domain-containing protein n=1 Tax=Microctonus aethiopoides TaxID=144406 RepID=A0AA39KK87_9HYME|nr:hypothetical protein PV328_003201 [Microctonus aethiopoides]